MSQYCGKYTILDLKACLIMPQHCGKYTILNYSLEHSTCHCLWSNLLPFYAPIFGGYLDFALVHLSIHLKILWRRWKSGSICVLSTHFKLLDIYSQAVRKLPARIHVFLKMCYCFQRSDEWESTVDCHGIRCHV